MTDRDGVPLPGLTVPDVVSQLTFRVLGPYKNRARSVIEWAGVSGQPAQTKDVAAKYGVTKPAIGQRVKRVAASGARLPMSAELEAEVSRAIVPSDNRIARTRQARLLGTEVLLSLSTPAGLEDHELSKGSNIG